MLLNNPIIQCDGYKFSHKNMYPKGTQKVLTNFTARSGKHRTNKLNYRGKDGVINFGIQYFINNLINGFQDNFFNKPIDNSIVEFEFFSREYLNDKRYDLTHWRDLHSLGYIPLEIKSLPEGSFVPYGIPMFTIENTHDDYFWLVNYFETLISSEVWNMITNATTSTIFKKLITKFNDNTSDKEYFKEIQCHDFSFRGMHSSDAAIKSGMAHLLNFDGTDTFPATIAMDEYYFSRVGSSVPASEHSVTTLGIHKENADDLYQGEKSFILKMINEIHPTGVVSYVADSYDYWSVLSNILPEIKDAILKRDGTLVIRPDSGDPYEVICGKGDMAYTKKEELITDLKNNNKEKLAEYVGSVQTLWNTFGGSINSKGYKELNSKIGLIYGDSITIDLAEKILSKLTSMGFASDCIVFGIGSFTYSYITRDTDGTCCKATWALVDNKEYPIFKAPKTDPNKKSLKGRFVVLQGKESLYVIDDLTVEQENQYTNNKLQTIFKDSKFITLTNYTKIKNNINEVING